MKNFEFTQTLEQPNDLLQFPLLQSKSGFSHLPLTSVHGGYFRSKITSNNHIASNRLVSAAHPLLITIANLREYTSHLDPYALNQVLIHEIKAFETNAQTLGYRAEIIMIARYILCTALDETTQTTQWKQDNPWPKQTLLSFFSNEEWGGERFFLILDRLIIDPATHIDLLELIYLCLSLGYMGKYQQLENRRAELDTIIEQLYEQIRQQRGELKKELHIHCEAAPVNALPKTKTFPIEMLALATVTLLLLTLYIGFNLVIENSISPLYQELTQLTQIYAN